MVWWAMVSAPRVRDSLFRFHNLYQSNFQVLIEEVVILISCPDHLPHADRNFPSSIGLLVNMTFLTEEELRWGSKESNEVVIWWLGQSDLARERNKKLNFMASSSIWILKKTSSLATWRNTKPLSNCVKTRSKEKFLFNWRCLPLVDFGS